MAVTATNGMVKIFSTIEYVSMFPWISCNFRDKNFLFLKKNENNFSKMKFWNVSTINHWPPSLNWVQDRSETNTLTMMMMLASQMDFIVAQASGQQLIDNVFLSAAQCRASYDSMFLDDLALISTFQWNV